MDVKEKLRNRVLVKVAPKVRVIRLSVMMLLKTHVQRVEVTELSSCHCYCNFSFFIDNTLRCHQFYKSQTNVNRYIVITLAVTLMCLVQQEVMRGL